MEDLHTGSLIPNRTPSQKFKHECGIHLERIRTLVDRKMKNEGSKEEDSQKICLTNRLDSLQAAVNGVEDQDIPPETYTHSSNGDPLFGEPGEFGIFIRAREAAGRMDPRKGATLSAEDIQALFKAVPELAEFHQNALT